MKIFVAASAFLVTWAQALVLPGGNAVLSISAKSSSLNWAPCHLELAEAIGRNITEPIDCATLEVPLDYTNSSSDRTIKLDLVRIKASEQPFKGSVLYNPGGPGISGIDTVAFGGPILRNILGGQFDVIGFDPRGTGRTIPFACDTASILNPTSKSRRSLNTLPQTNVWPLAKNEGWKYFGLVADACFESQKEFGRYIGTPFVARDMMSIVDALGEDGMLRYWGMSYGTVLGQVVTSMFPDRIDRVLLDGVLLADDYATSTWKTSSLQTENGLDHFLSDCVEAGPLDCPLADYFGPTTTAEDLKEGLKQLFNETMSKHAIPPEYDLSEELFPYGGHSVIQQLKSFITTYLYSPKQYPALAKILRFALRHEWKSAFSFPPQSIGSNWNKGSDALFGIACSDSSFRVESAEDMYSALQSHLVQSSFADDFAVPRLGCSRWKLDAVEKIDTNKLRNVKTRWPVLLINGIYDPVTPVHDAWEASVRLGGSRTLIHEGVGHGSISHPSKCVNSVISEYFVNGTLPEVGAICKPDMSAFEYVTHLKTSGPGVGGNHGN